MTPVVVGTYWEQWASHYSAATPFSCGCFGEFFPNGAWWQYSKNFCNICNPVQYLSNVKYCPNSRIHRWNSKITPRMSLKHVIHFSPILFNFSTTCLFQQLSLLISGNPTRLIVASWSFVLWYRLWYKALLRGCHGSFPHRWAAKPSKPKWWTSPVSSGRPRYSSTCPLQGEYHLFHLKHIYASINIII